MKQSKIILLFVGLISCGVVFASNNEQANTSQLFSGLDSDAAKTVIAFHEALENGEQAKARALLDDDVLIYEGGGVERSAEEYANHHLQADMQFLAKMQVKTLEHRVTVNGNFAISTSRSHTTGVYHGKPIDSNGMETMVLILKDGQWKISHIHWSN